MSVNIEWVMKSILSNWKRECKEKKWAEKWDINAERNKREVLIHYNEWSFMYVYGPKVNVLIFSVSDLKKKGLLLSKKFKAHLSN